ncbi:hypothetical protein ACWDT6_09795 [Nocardia grenadensis]
MLFAGARADIDPVARDPAALHHAEMLDLVKSLGLPRQGAVPTG